MIVFKKNEQCGESWRKVEHDICEMKKKDSNQLYDDDKTTTTLWKIDTRISFFLIEKKEFLKVTSNFLRPSISDFFIEEKEKRYPCAALFFTKPEILSVVFKKNFSLKELMEFPRWFFSMSFPWL